MVQVAEVQSDSGTVVENQVDSASGFESMAASKMTRLDSTMGAESLADSVTNSWVVENIAGSVFQTVEGSDRIPATDCKIRIHSDFGIAHFAMNSDRLAASCRGQVHRRRQARALGCLVEVQRQPTVEDPIDIPLIQNRRWKFPLKPLDQASKFAHRPAHQELIGKDMTRMTVDILGLLGTATESVQSPTMKHMDIPGKIERLMTDKEFATKFGSPT